MDNLGGLDFVPTEYVDISEEIDLKLEMLECHVSQLKWMRDHDHIDFAEFVKTCARYRRACSATACTPKRFRQWLCVTRKYCRKDYYRKGKISEWILTVQ